ncbi:hypothetical protein Pla163_23130 [Planctomycetes bacterium Pla163]|uniref:Uncharacterized protein n=1 Tax=Rohdeia mirabilis TaxID=2528008 RepID=A0A518D181_9BACT|nr:hypothetical protein Pla163_23130 [Planctomycetes bacterium Pla163]
MNRITLALAAAVVTTGLVLFVATRDAHARPPALPPVELPAAWSQVEGESLAQRYPELVDLVVADGHTLADLDLETCDPQLIDAFLTATWRVANGMQTELVASLESAGVELGSRLISRDLARERFEANPHAYFVAYSSPRSFGGRGFIDIAGEASPELFACQRLSAELSTHPRREAALVGAMYAPPMTTRTDSSGRESTVYPQVERWEREGPSQRLVGYDATDHVVMHIAGGCVGVP